LGGHRGLEATLVPAAGIPLRRLAARSLRTTEADVHAVLDPIRLGLSVPQATAILLAERPAAILTTGGYVAVPVLMAAAPLGIPVVMWDGNVIPGRAVRATARLASALAVSFAAMGLGITSLIAFQAITNMAVAKKISFVVIEAQIKTARASIRSP